ncbi:MAG: enoyl-CoA hydratase/isomerase family protein [Vicinamibacteria bacterium]|jgi:cyclohexa-1,5-dienecarbonyl-CoA hydratase|nr:enoyl-CoA hydratase/isomerase family protein [Vicinamibacteria bacterium]
MPDLVRVEPIGGSHAVTVSLDRPPMNVLDLATIGALRDALEAIASRRDVKAVVLRSAVPHVFSAGVDVAIHSRERLGAMLDAFHGVFRVMDGMPQVTVAAVDGLCLGGGCELAAFCDLVLATPGSSFGQPEIDVGCFPPLAAALLPRLIGRAAWEMVLLGSSIDAQRAAELGLVTRVVDDLPAAVDTWAKWLCAKSGAVLALARRALREGAHGSFAEGLVRTEAIYRDELAKTADVEEGVRAFLEKRRAHWSDR